MLLFNALQERVFEIIDDLIDKDIDVWEYIQKTPSLRIRILRNFPPRDGLSSVQVCLEAYGFDTPKEPTIPNQMDLYNCFVIEHETYGYGFDEEFVEHLSVIHNTPKNKIKKLAKEKWLKEVKEEILDYFVRTNEADFVANPNTYREISRIRIWFKDVVGDDINAFRQAFGISAYLNPNRTSHGLRYFTEAGRRLEEITERCFNEVQTKILIQKSIDGCRPDFITEDRWVDVKLSKSTTFHGKCKTIEKYTKHTDRLTIIYALDDVPDDSIPLLPNGVDMVHILDYFDDLPPELQEEIRGFISEVRKVKNGVLKFDERRDAS